MKSETNETNQTNETHNHPESQHRKSKFRFGPNRNSLTDPHNPPVLLVPVFQLAIRNPVEDAKEMVEFRHFGKRRAGEVVQSVEKGSVDDHAGPQGAEICRRDGSAEPSRSAEGQGEKVHQDHADGRWEEHRQLEKEDRLLVMFPADEVGQMGQDTARGRDGGHDDGHAGETHDAFRCL